MGRIPKPCRNGKELLRRRAKFNPMADACCSPVVQVQDSTADTHGEPVLTFTPGGMHVNHPSSQGGKMSRNGPRQGQNASAFSPEICPCFSRMDPGTPQNFRHYRALLPLDFPDGRLPLLFPDAFLPFWRCVLCLFRGRISRPPFHFPDGPGLLTLGKESNLFQGHSTRAPWPRDGLAPPGAAVRAWKNRCEQTRWDRIRYPAGTSKYPHAHIHTRACEHEVCVPTGCMPHTRMPPLSAMGTQGFKACGNRGCLNRFVVDRYLNMAAWG